MAFVITVVVMAFVILGVKFSATTGSIIGIDFGKAASDRVALAYPWYTLLGVVITLIAGGLLSLRHGTPDPLGGGVARQPEPVSDAA